MYNFRFGIRAIIVGICDLIILLGSIVVSIIWAACAKSLTIMLVSEAGPIHSMFRQYITIRNATTALKDGEVRVDYICMSAGVDIAISVLQFGATVALIQTATRTTKPRKSLKIAWAWFILNLSVLTAYIAWRSLDQNWISLGVGILTRGVLLYNVFKFIQELRKVTSVNCSDTSFKEEWNGIGEMMERPKTQSKGAL